MEPESILSTLRLSRGARCLLDSQRGGKKKGLQLNVTRTSTTFTATSSTFILTANTRTAHQNRPLDGCILTLHVCVCFCVVLQVFQGLPELLHPRTRLHFKDIFKANKNAPHRPPGEGAPPRVGSRAVHSPAHTKLCSRSLAERRESNKSTLCRDKPRTQTDPGGSIQGVKTSK